MTSFKIYKNTVTPRDDLQLNRYLKEIFRIPLISPQEEVELSIKIKQGDKDALDKLVKSNLRFVFSVAKEYQRNGVPLGDLINEGNIGLIKAAERFDHTMGFKFISYATWRIRAYIYATIAETGKLVRIPANQIDRFKKIGATQDRLRSMLEREPTSTEICDELLLKYPDREDWTDDKLKSYMHVGAKYVSLDSPIDGDPERSLHDSINIVNAYYGGNAPDVDTIFALNDAQIEILDALKKVLEENSKHKNPDSIKKTSIDHADIIKMHYGLAQYDREYTLDEIAKKYNVSKERIRQLVYKIRFDLSKMLLKNT